MSEHLTIEESKNAKPNIQNNKQKIKKLVSERQTVSYLLKLKTISEQENSKLFKRFNVLSQKITGLRKLNDKLKNHIYHETHKIKKFGELPEKRNLMFEMFGKKKSQLTSEEYRLYNTKKQQEHRKIKKGE